MKGSDTMVQLGQSWAELYMKEHPDITIQVTAGGSGTGIAALIEGTTQICQASRAMKDTEKESLKTKRNLDAVETPVALDALAVYVNKENAVKSLTMEQVAKIFLGEVTNWKDVGGTPGNIVLYGRENSSGTYVYFKEHVLANKDFPTKYQALPGTGAVVNAVAKDKGGVGYGGIGYATDIKTIPITKDAGGMPIEPTMANVLSGAYPISRQLFWYTAGPAEGTVKAFQDWVLSPEGQKVVSEKGFYPLKGE
jgi:phosphate transport system substrate-binding protein